MSWKTTLFGLIAAIGGAILATYQVSPEMLAGFPTWLKGVGALMSAIGTAGIGVFARDNNKSSEQVGAGPKPVPSADTLAKLAVWLVAVGALFGCIFALGGCASVAPGADPFLVRVEQGQVMGDATVSFVLDIDQSDRGFWRTNAPAFHTFCEYLRAKIPNPSPADTNHTSPRVLLIEENVHQLKETYKFSKTSGNSNALYIAFDEFSTLVSQASSWSNIVTTPTH